MSIDTKQIQKLATLSRLSFDSEQLAKFQADFANIIKFVEQIQAVNTEGVQPMSSTVGGTGTPERPDAVTETDNRDANQKVAPKTDMGFYTVPRIVE